MIGCLLWLFSVVWSGCFSIVVYVLIYLLFLYWFCLLFDVSGVLISVCLGILLLGLVVWCLFRCLDASLLMYLCEVFGCVLLGLWMLIVGVCVFWYFVFCYLL